MKPKALERLAIALSALSPGDYRTTRIAIELRRLYDLGQRAALDKMLKYVDQKLEELPE